MLVLGIETSCDETSAAVVEDGRKLYSNIVASQVELHKRYGGVVPEIASRKHVSLINLIVQEALVKAGVTLKEIDIIAVTYGPGLVGALLVGVSLAKALAYGLNKVLVGVNHIRGHIAANYLEHSDLEPPYLCLVVSGGHTTIANVKNYRDIDVIGRTRDDAAGEAFDKIARAIGLGYPGGPEIDRASKEGNPKAVDFPRVIFDDGTYDFSFSGPKTAVLNWINSKKQKGEDISIPDVAASFQRAVVDVLVDNTISAAKRLNIRKIALAGGVAANSLLRAEMGNRCKELGIKLYYPGNKLCTDNAGMIASEGYYSYLQGRISGLDLNAEPSLKI